MRRAALRCRSNAVGCSILRVSLRKGLRCGHTNSIIARSHLAALKIHFIPADGWVRFSIQESRQGTSNLSTTAISSPRWSAGWASRNARHNPLAAVGVLLVVIFVIFALFAPWIAPQDPASINLPARLDPPRFGLSTSAHWFGTDELGRDILSRLIYGARISMLVGTCVVLASRLDSSSAPSPDTTEAPSTASSTSC
jgi:hypothetical protein